MNFIAWAHRHSRSILFLLTVLAIAGAASSFNLPVSLFPQVSFPRIRVSLDAGAGRAHGYRGDHSGRGSRAGNSWRA